MKALTTAGPGVDSGWAAVTDGHATVVLGPDGRLDLALGKLREGAYLTCSQRELLAAHYADLYGVSDPPPYDWPLIRDGIITAAIPPEEKTRRWWDWCDAHSRAERCRFSDGAVEVRDELDWPGSLDSLEDHCRALADDALNALFTVRA